MELLCGEQESTAGLIAEFIFPVQVEKCVSHPTRKKI